MRSHEIAVSAAPVQLALVVPRSFSSPAHLYIKFRTNHAKHVNAIEHLMEHPRPTILIGQHPLRYRTVLHCSSIPHAMSTGDCTNMVAAETI